jgi:hypothetical protein
MITTFEMSIKIRSAKYYSKIFNLHLCHFNQSMSSFRFNSFFLEILIRKGNNFFYFLPCCISMIVEIVFNQAIRIIPM